MPRIFPLIMLTLLMAACTPTSSAPTATATATPIPTATVTPTSTPITIPSPTVAAPPTSGQPLLRTFAHQIDEAVSDQDVDALVALTRETEIDCRQVAEPDPSCPEGTLGTVRRGIPIGLWRSEYDLSSVEEYRHLLSRFFADSLHGEADDYGSGEPRLFDIRYPSPTEGELEAILTAIGSQGRTALLLRSAYQQDGWSIAALVMVGPNFIDEALAPGPSYYDVER